jgi:hypothetical protein
MTYDFELGAVRADILVRSDDGYPIAIIEIEPQHDLIPEAAMTLRHRVLSQDLIREVAYFIVLSQQSGYLWKGEQDLNEPPMYEFQMNQVLARYVPETDLRQGIDTTRFQLAVFQWVIDLTKSQLDVTEEADRTLVSSGFVASLTGALVLAEALIARQKTLVYVHL